jgi:glucosamine 6-phosphate synthetase-like amidotransferase/phosphosugar isomerase protein
MCGICYAKSFTEQPVKSIIKNQFENQRNRGTDGFGFAAVYEGYTDIVHRTTELDIKRALREANAREILFHHRLPTSTDNVKNACHPFKAVGLNTGHVYFVVHNGIISNDDELLADHRKHGIAYASKQPDGRYNDSESLANELMLCFEGKKKWKSFKARGSIAFIALETDQYLKPLKLHYGRNSGSPLMLKDNKKTLQISSQATHAESVEPNIIFTRDYTTQATTRKSVDLGYTYYTNSYGGYYGNYYNYGTAYQNADSYKDDQHYDKDFADRSENYTDGYADAMEESYLRPTEVSKALVEIQEEIRTLQARIATEKNAKRRAELTKEKNELQENVFYYIGYKDGTAQREEYFAQEEAEEEEYATLFGELEKTPKKKGQKDESTA